MSKIEKFEDILVWQKAETMVIEIYQTFQKCNDFAFRDQIRRAALSVMNNIAEGYERQGNKEFSKFLYIAKGSSGEVRSMLYVAHKLRYIDKDTFDVLKDESIQISKLLSIFIKRLY